MVLLVGHQQALRSLLLEFAKRGGNVVILLRPEGLVVVSDFFDGDLTVSLCRLLQLFNLVVGLIMLGKFDSDYALLHLVVGSLNLAIVEDGQ